MRPFASGIPALPSPKGRFPGEGSRYLFFNILTKTLVTDQSPNPGQTAQQAAQTATLPGTQPGAPANDVEVAECDGIEGPGIDAGAGHRSRSTA